VQKYDIRKPEAEGGGFEERYWSPRNTPVLGRDGHLAYIIHRVEDVTEFMRLKQQGIERDKLTEELRDRTKQMEVEVFLRAREVEAANKRLEDEQRLRQVQKMEAVGHLTGGIAHDFNNILTVIMGMAEVLSEELAGDPVHSSSVRMISDAAGRGAEVTKQLLAFSRQQPLQPRETDINALVEDTARLLRPTLGEHIEMHLALEEDSWFALVDPNHLATALLNLAVNARDAMADGGKLTLETGNVYLDEAYAMVNHEVRLGHYVMLAVSDTGSGIPAEIRDKVFEPFFTTKETGKGTGLGLSMVYGFVKQSNGHIKIYSEEGHGTSIKLYLPRAMENGSRPEQPASNEASGGSETILVVEDDPFVRNYVNTQLVQLGYRATLAANGPEALAEIEKGLVFDLLLTDMIMPGGMNGRQLADAVRLRRPAVRVLFTSGYTEDAIIHHGRLDPGVLLLPKPYRRSDLARMIRLALERGM
jgi:signal transduction histidine kinase